MRKTKSKGALDGFSDEELLGMKIRDFKLRIEGSRLEGLIENLYSELEARGVKFRPPCYLADEWLCPDKEPIIGIPFFLAHPRLRRIEKRMMFEVEGGTEVSFMRLLRHEAGHALNYAYELYKRTRWRQLFGRFSSKYSNSYYYQPYSRRFVMHLKGHYAQAHPDEDFAETFAVWLAPNMSWEKKYKNWPVIKKLKYVDGLMRKICDESPVKVSKGKPPWSASRMTSTLAAYYERRRKGLGEEFRGFYDDALIKLFSSKHGADPQSKASEILKQHRRELVDSVSRWTGHRKYDIYQLVNKLIHRCRVLELYGTKEDMIAVSTLITAIVCNTLWIPSGDRK